MDYIMTLDAMQQYRIGFGPSLAKQYHYGA
jgi:hypothetical protein